MIAPISSTLPADFSHLEQFVDTWSLQTMAARHAQRLNSSPEQRQVFYQTMAPCLRDVMAYLDGYALGAMPEDAQRLLRLALSLMEVTMTIEVYDPQMEAAHTESSRFVKFHRELDGR